MGPGDDDNETPEEHDPMAVVRHAKLFMRDRSFAPPVPGLETETPPGQAPQTPPEPVKQAKPKRRVPTDLIEALMQQLEDAAAKTLDPDRAKKFTTWNAVNRTSREVWHALLEKCLDNGTEGPKVDAKTKAAAQRFVLVLDAVIGRLEKRYPEGEGSARQKFLRHSLVDGLTGNRMLAESLALGRPTQMRHTVKRWAEAVSETKRVDRTIR